MEILIALYLVACIYTGCVFHDFIEENNKLDHAPISRRTMKCMALLIAIVAPVVWVIMGMIDLNRFIRNK